MKNRINQLARGVYDSDVPVMEIAQMSIEEVISADDIYSGEVRIFSNNNLPIKGVIYSDNPYVTILNSNFNAPDNLIAYRVDAKGLKTRHVISGKFDIVSDAGEKSIPYSFMLTDKTVETGIGQLRNMFHFANYVQADYDRALKLFASNKFKEVFIGEDKELMTLYEALIRSSDVRMSVEEFLVATHKKAKISLSLSQNSKVFVAGEDNFEEKIVISKDNWGYVRASVKTDGDFIKLRANNVDSDVFVGNNYELIYMVDVTKLHAGKNYGNIIIRTDSQELKYQVTVINGAVAEREVRHNVKKSLVKLINTYILFRTRKIDVTTWINESFKQIEIIRSLDDSDPLIKLAQAHIFIADKKDTQAKWLIDSVKDEVIQNKDKNLEVYCYYLYVTSLFNKDRLYAIKIMEQIRGYYESGNDSWKILWFLLYLDDENDKNKSLKLIRLKEQFYKGCTSPIMYLEAVNILEEKPMLFRVLDEFEVQVINFGCRNKLISKKTAEYIGHMIKSEKNVKRPLINILMCMYKEFGSEEVLLTLCEALIRNNCVGRQYFEWYELGVKQEFKVTKLYEYYVSSIDMGSMERLPKQILLYFMYNNEVDYKAKAYVYANVTFNRIINPQIFDNYKKDIVEFAISQLKQGHINNNLALIYSNVLTPELINEGNSTYLPKILFTYKVDCKMRNVANVIVRHKECDLESVYPVNNGKAYIQMYTADAVVILETTHGRRYVDDSHYNITRLLDEDHYLDALKNTLMENVFVAIYFARKYMMLNEVNTLANESYICVLKDKTVNRLFKSEVATLMVDYYYNAYETDDSFNAFVMLLEDVKLSRTSQGKLVEIFISRNEHARAYNFIKEKNVYPSNGKRIYRIASKLVATMEKPEDKIIDKLCEMCITNKKYDDSIINYLVNNYNSSIKKMYSLWEIAGNFMVERYQLSERIIAQALFTRTYNPNIGEVFEDYYNHGANERLVEAYINYNCYNNFVKGSLIDADIFAIVEHRILYGVDVDNACKLALLSAYAELIELTDKQLGIAREVMEELVRDGMEFAFFKNFLGKLPLPYSVIDKTYVEYRTSKDAKVIIHYIYENDEGQKGYVVEDMRNVYEGIFVRPFVLFYGEAIQYYITEVVDGVTNVTESKKLANSVINPNQTDGRYEAINDILASLELRDMVTMKKLLHGYAVKDYVTEKMFTSLN